MNWLDKLERKFRFAAIPNLILYVVGLQAVATLLGVQSPGVQEQMVLDPQAFFRGEWWRLFTFIFVPDVSRWGILLAVFWFYFLWMMGQALEAEWGAFRTTFYLLSGAVFQALVSLLAWSLLGWPITQNGYFWSLSIQLAFAHLYPEFTIYLFFILPIKMRWWAIFIFVLLGLQVYSGGLPALLMVCGSLLNYLLFFGGDFFRKARERRRTQIAREEVRESVQAAVALMPAKICRRCGRDARATDIRLCLCSACGEEGAFWCTDHLGEHLAQSEANLSRPVEAPDLEAPPKPRARKAVKKKKAG